MRPDQITARVGDTAFPPSPGSGGSTTSPSISPAVRVACVNALNALNARVGEGGKLGASVARGSGWRRSSSTARGSRA